MTGCDGFMTGLNTTGHIIFSSENTLSVTSVTSYVCKKLSIARARMGEVSEMTGQPVTPVTGFR